MSSPPVNTLLLIAMPAEAGPLLERLAARELLRRGPHAAYLSGGLLLGISGIGQHNCCALASLLLAQHPAVRRVVNFGCAGAYPAAGLANGSCALVSQVAKWDLRLPLDGFSAELAPCRLDCPPQLLHGLPRLHCNSGCSFSSPAARQSPDFPQASLEDMELYGLAVLCAAHGLPLQSLKFVSNQVGPGALAEFRSGFALHLAAAQSPLEELLRAG